MAARDGTKTAHHREHPAFRRAVRTLARRVRDLREERGWTIEQAAEKYLVEPAHVRRIEAGDANPSLGVLVSLARAFGVSVGQLVDPDGAASRRPKGS